MIGFGNPAKDGKRKPRKRAQPVWRRTSFQVAAFAAVAFTIGAGGWWSWRSGIVDHYTEIAAEKIVSASAKAGLRVEEVLVVGREETESKALLDALGVSRSAPILGFDVELARRRVESLPWVRSASVERLLPDTILLSVEERRPLALWQNKGEFALIDYEGVVIVRENLTRFSNLLTVVGDDAPAHAANLLEMLGSQPELMKQVKAAIRVGGRRWNLRMNDEIDVRLPEQGAATAWLRLAEYERDHRVLERDVDVVDLRVPDRLIVRKTGSGDNDLRTVGADGQET
ncbi:MAG: FtsQ-type POTRA domain-containing protein [Rhodospirillales bacterium]